MQSFEQAKIDEVRDTPVLTVLSQPQLPAIPDPRDRFRLLLTATFAGLAAAVVVLYLLSQFGDDAGSVDSDRAELALLTDELKAEVKRGHVLRAIFGASPPTVRPRG